MTSSDKHGGPAFPISTAAYQDGLGMTLRDYFAAKALVAGQSANKTTAYSDETRARYAYELADAMLKARDGTH